MTKTLVNSLYIGLLIIAPICILLWSADDPLHIPGFLLMLPVLAMGFGPLILTLIQNTAHEITISMLNLALMVGSLYIIGSGRFIALDEVHETKSYIFLAITSGSVFALWLWQCFDGRRPKKQHQD